jgi:DNA-binding MarR family transcriptional regulator
MEKRKKEIENIRDFNRFYTNIIGVLDKRMYKTNYSLPEARILFEIYHLKTCTARQIMEKIIVDEGYLSRIIQGFVKKKLIKKSKSKEDGRAYFLSLTPAGKSEFELLNQTSQAEIATLIKDLSASEIKELLRNMSSIRSILAKSTY